MNATFQVTDPAAGGGADFRTTHWSVVLNAGGDASPQSAAAIESLCRAYWYPLYAFVRRKGHGPEDAQDITQEFFARLLRLDSLRGVGREKGRFRTFLLVSLNHFLCDALDRARAAKRGGGRPVLSLDDENAEQRYAAELSIQLSPEKLYDRRWALTVLNNALTQLQGEFTRAGKTGQFDLLRGFLSNEVVPGTYERLAPTLEMSPRAVGMAVCRLRQRYMELIRAEVAATVAQPSDTEAELNYLFEVLGQ